MTKFSFSFSNYQHFPTNFSSILLGKKQKQNMFFSFRLFILRPFFNASLHMCKYKMPYELIMSVLLKAGAHSIHAPACSLQQLNRLEQNLNG